jgi:MFS family permease
LGLIFLTVFMDIIGFSIIIPLFPHLLNHYITTEGAQGTLIGMLSSAAEWLGGTTTFQKTVLFGGLLSTLYSLLQFIFSPIWGSLSDRYGRRKILTITLAGNALSYFIWIFAGQFWVVVLTRLICGMMAGNIAVASAAATAVAANAAAVALVEAAALKRKRASDRRGSGAGASTEVAVATAPAAAPDDEAAGGRVRFMAAAVSSAPPGEASVSQHRRAPSPPPRHALREGATDGEAEGWQHVQLPGGAAGGGGHGGHPSGRRGAPHALVGRTTAATTVTSAATAAVGTDDDPDPCAAS